MKYSKMTIPPGVYRLFREHGEGDIFSRKKIRQQQWRRICSCTRGVEGVAGTVIWLAASSPANRFGAACVAVAVRYGAEVLLQKGTEQYGAELYGKVRCRTGILEQRSTA